MNKVAHGIGRFLRVLGLATLVLIPFIAAYLLYNAIGTFMGRGAPQIPQVMAVASPTIPVSPATVVGITTPTVGKSESTVLATSTTTVQVKPTETAVVKVQPTSQPPTSTPIRSESTPKPVPTATPVPRPTPVSEPARPQVTWFSIGAGEVIRVNKEGCVSGDVAMAWDQDQEFTPYHDEDGSTAQFVCISGDVEAGWAKTPFGASGVYGLGWEQLGDTIKAQGKFSKVIGLLFPGAVPIYEK